MMKKKGVIILIALVLLFCSISAILLVFFGMKYLGEENHYPKEAEQMVSGAIDVQVISPTTSDWYITEDSSMTVSGMVSHIGELDDVKTYLNGEEIENEIDLKGGALNTLLWTTELEIDYGINSFEVEAILADGSSIKRTLYVLKNGEDAELSLESKSELIDPDAPNVELLLTISFSGDGRAGQLDLVTLYTSNVGVIETVVAQISETGQTTDKPYKADLADHLQNFEGDELYLALRYKPPVGEYSYSQPILFRLQRSADIQSYQEIVDHNVEVEQKFAELQGESTEFVAWLKEQEWIRTAGIAEDGYGLWWEFEGSGILSGKLNSPEDKKGLFATPLVKQVCAQSETNGKVGNLNAVYLGPYLSDFGQDDDYYNAWKLMKDSECPDPSETEVKNSKVSLDDFKSLDQYGIIVVSSHGDTWFNGIQRVNKGGYVVILSGVPFTQAIYEQYKEDFIAQRLAVSDSSTVMILPSFIEKYNGRFNDSIVYISACRSTYNLSMASVFLGKGAKSYLGYSDYVYTWYAADIGREFFDEIILNENDVGGAFREAILLNGEHDRTPPPGKPAYTELFGNEFVKVGGTECCDNNCIGGNVTDTVEIVFQNPQYQTLIHQLTFDLSIDPTGPISGAIEVNVPEYNVVLDPESADPLVIRTESGSGVISVSGEWDATSEVGDYFDIELDGKYYPVELSADTEFTFTSNGVSEVMTSYDEFYGAYNGEKLHIYLQSQAAGLNYEPMWLDVN